MDANEEVLDSDEQVWQQQFNPSDQDLNSKDDDDDENNNDRSAKAAEPNYVHSYVWRNIVVMSVLHVLGVMGLFAVPWVHWATCAWTIALLLLSALGVQAGAHRLWSHRAYKANLGLRIVLSCCFALALQNDLYEWCRDHRGHHKFSETDGDPHNSQRGFFFSHIGWLLVRKHPEVLRRGRTLDLSDLEADPVVRFQRQYYIPMVLLFWALIPVLVPVWLWNESWTNSVLVALALRYTYSLNITWCVNSWSHLFGDRPYDRHIAPVEATIRHLLMGEGFHNYHHAFPWDYSASELGAWDVFNPCTAAIDAFAWMGWVWDRKKVDPSLVHRTMHTRGDQGLAARYRPEARRFEWLTGLWCIALPFLLLRFIVPQLKQPYE